MYEQQFDSDWEDLTIDEATRRAYAIGVAASLGKDFTEELKRIHRYFDAPYDRSLVELSFEEGRNRADKEFGSGSNASEIWNELVTDDALETVEPDTSHRGSQSIPNAVHRASMLDTRVEGVPTAVSLPAFLRGP